MQLFHFSDDDSIQVFQPRPVKIAADRAEGMNWLNGPLVWAIDEWHQPMYLFPRDCPRILMWPISTTTSEDYRAYWTTSCRMIAYVEYAWLDKISTANLYRYEFSSELFESLDDAGMWISRHVATPIKMKKIDNVLKALEEANVEIRSFSTLESLKSLWNTSFHVSGIRLRNMQS